MSKTEYSRILVKRSSQVGSVPTIPATSEIDNTWLDTDLLIGEMFINTVDDRIWYRSSTGIIEIIGGSAETVTTLVDNGDGSITYTNEDGTPVTLNGIIGKDLHNSVLNPTTAHDGNVLTWDDASSKYRLAPASVPVVHTYSIAGRWSFNGDLWRGTSSTNSINGTTHSTQYFNRSFPFGSDANADGGVGTFPHTNGSLFGHVMPANCTLTRIDALVYNAISTMELAVGVLVYRLNGSNNMEMIDSAVVSGSIGGSDSALFGLQLASPISLLRGDSIVYVMASETTQTTTRYCPASITITTEQ